MQTVAKKTFGIYRKVVTGKWYRRIFLTALLAFALVWGVGTAAGIVRDFVAYHTFGCLAAAFVGANVLLSREKLLRIWKKLSILAEDVKPAAVSRSAREVAAEFAEKVNVGGDEFTEFED